MNVAEVSKKVAEERRNRIKAEQLKNLSKVSLEDLFSHIAEGEVKTLNIVVKADVHGSVEAVKQALEKLSNEEVRVKCIHGGVCWPMPPTPSLSASMSVPTAEHATLRSRKRSMSAPTASFIRRLKMLKTL